MIEKVAAVILREGRVLVCRKRGTDVYLSPGGKVEPGETAWQCLARELVEEVGVGVRSAEPLGTFGAASALEPGTVRMQVFLAEIDGAPEPGAEIDRLAWVGADAGRGDGITVGSVFAEQVIPLLVERGLVERGPAGSEPVERDVVEGAARHG